MDEKRHHPVLKFLGITLLVLVIAIGVCAVFVFSSAVRLKNDGKQILDDVEVIIDQVSNGDIDDFVTDIADIQARIDDIDAEVDGPLWTMAAYLPVIGEDIAIAQTLVDVGDDLVDNAIIPILDEVSQIDLTNIVTEILSGEFSLSEIEELTATFENSIAVIDRSDYAIDSLPEPNFDSLREIIDQTKSIMDQITSVSDTIELGLELADAVTSFMQ